MTDAPRELDPAKVIDFDAFRAEQKAETIPVKVGGVVYEVPATPPASAVLDAMRRRRDGTSRITSEAVFELAAEILGDQSETIIRTAGLSVPDLMALVTMVAERQAAAVTPPPNRAARRKRPPRKRSTSSSPGRPSRPTSSGNTRSTSGQSSKR